MRHSMVAIWITVIMAVCGGVIGKDNIPNKGESVTSKAEYETSLKTDGEAPTVGEMECETSSRLDFETEKGDVETTSEIESEATSKGEENIDKPTILIPESTANPSTKPNTRPTQESVTNQKPSIVVPQTTKKPSIQVPQTTKKPEGTQNLSYARQVVVLVNEERKKAGLNELKIDAGLEKAALIRAKETEKSFSHTRPDGKGFSTVLTENGISFRGSGENIAWGQSTPEIVMNGWMNSSGHRANILNSKFTKIGVGYYIGANGRKYWTQLFIY